MESNLPCNETDAVKLAALKLQIDGGDYNSGKQIDVDVGYVSIACMVLSISIHYV